MLGMLCLTIKPLPAHIWKWCSGFAFVILTSFAVRSATIFRRLQLRQVQSFGRATPFVFYLFGILGTAVTILQLYNAAILGTFALFFTAIVFQLTGAMFQFTRIVLVPPK